MKRACLPLRAACIAYSLLLRTYPNEFRVRYGPEMAQVFRERCRSVLETRGLPGLPWFVLETLADWLRSAVREHVDALRAPASAAVANAVIAPKSDDDVPTFFICGPDAPRSTALVNGFVLALLMVVTLSLGLHQSIVQRRAAAPLRHFRSVAGGTWTSPDPTKPVAWSFLTDGGFEEKKMGEHAEGPLPLLLQQFDRYDIVALGETRHGSQEDFLLQKELLQSAALRRRVRNVVVEWGNSLQQDTLDRYLRGEDTPAAELAKLWRDTTQSPVQPASGCSTCVELLKEIRALNQASPSEEQIRVLAGDPPIDWTQVKRTEDYVPFLRSRDTVPAGIIARDVLGKGEKALVLYGAGHLWRGNAFVREPNLANLLDDAFPNRTFTVLRLSGGGPDMAPLESLITDRRRPIVLLLRKHPAGSLPANDFVGRDIPVSLFPTGFTLRQVADAIVYTGAIADASLGSPPPDFAAGSALTEEELSRRRRLMPKRGR